VIENKESAVKKSEEELLGINEMKFHIEEGYIGCVYCYELSRLSRRPKVLYSLRDYFIEHNVQLVVMNPYFKLLNDDETLNQSSNIIFALYSSFAETETKLLKDRCKRGKEKRRKDGYFVGGKPLFGYAINSEKRFIINEEEAQAVRDVYTLFINDISKLQIAKLMRSKGYFLNFQSAIDTHTAIDNILRNRDYTGQHGKPRIISDDIFEAAMRKHPTVKKTRTTTKRLALGRSFIFNPDCQTKRDLYYVNTTSGDYFSYTVDKETRIFVKIVYIDALIWYVVKKHYRRYISAFPKAQIELKSVKNKKAIDGKIKALNDDIKELTEKIQTIEERLIYGKLNIETAERIESQIEKHIKVKQEQLQELTKSLETIPTYDSKTDIDTLPDDDKCRIVKMIFSYITLRRDKKYHWYMDFWLDNETCERYMIYTRNPDYYLLNGDDKTKIEL